MKSFFLTFLLFLLSACAPDSSDDVIRVGIEAEYPPFSYKVQGELKGLEISLINAVAKTLNKRVEFSEMSFSCLVPALNSGQIDLAIAAFNITEARKKEIDFSQVYFYNKLVFVHKGSLGDLSGKIIGAQTGSTMEKAAQRLAKDFNGQVHSLNTNPQIIEELKLGRVDLMISEEIQAQEFCNAPQSVLQYSPLLEELFTLSKEELGYAIAFKKGSLLVSQVNEALQKIQESGEMDKIITTNTR